MSVISVKNVSKIFRHKQSRALLRDQIRDVVSGPRKQGFYALKNVSFEVQENEGVALIGANGAGKSTMLGLVCKLAEPDEGSIEVTGSIAPLLELGSGFHPDLTGMENLVLNAALLGMNESRTREALPGIVAFSELGEFIKDPLRTYSSGMVLRLAFSVAVHCNPSIIIIDEVLAVGDISFQQKCLNRIMELRKSGRTFLCVSHNAYTVERFCERAIWLHHGQLVMDGPTPVVAAAYSEFMQDPSRPLPTAAAESREAVAGASGGSRKRR